MQELRHITSALAQRTQLATFGSSSQQPQQSSKSAGADPIQPATKEAQPQLQGIMKSDSSTLSKPVSAVQSCEPSVFTYDPDSETVYAVVNAEIKIGDQQALDPAKIQSLASSSMTSDSMSSSGVQPGDLSIPIVVQVSAATESVHPKIKNLVSSHSSTEEETKVSKQSPAGSLDPSRSADEIEDQFKGEIEHYASLNQLSSKSSHHALFANERKAGVSQYELPQSSVFKDNAEINFVDTYSQPQCMRFCPALSSSDVELSHTGLTARAINVQDPKAADASNPANHTFVVGNMSFLEGVHYWEFICPISCDSMEIGITSNGKNPTIITEKFMSTTRRTVGVYLDLNEGTLSFWINGQHNKKTKSKQLKKLGYSWRPYLRFMEKLYVVILKPFCRLPQTPTNAPTHISKLPNSIQDNLNFIQISYIADLIRSHLLVVNNNAITDAVMKENLKKQCTQEFDIAFPSEAEKGKGAQVVALLCFKNQFEANLYAQTFSDRMKDCELLDAWNIAKVVHSRFTNASYRISFNNLNKVQMQAIRTLYSKFLVENLFEAQRWITISMMAGVSEQPTHKTAMSDALASLEMLVKQQKNITHQVPALLHNHEESEHGVSRIRNLLKGPTQITYLKHQQSMLVANGPEVKVFSKFEGTVQMANFSNYAQVPEDKIGLQLPIQDLDFLLEHVQWSSLEMELAAINFLRDIAQFYVDGYVVLPYITAISGINAILETVRNQYNQFDQFCNRVNLKDIQKDKKITKNPAIKKPMSFNQVNKLMRIILDLEDQLWAMTQSDLVSERVKRLWIIKPSRMHTAYSRLASFVDFTDSENPLALSELGLYNYADQEKKISHFMEPLVPIESIYDSSDSTPLHATLEKQFANNYMLKGLQTWNVPLHKTINSLPPSIHQNFLPSSEPKYAAIDTIKSLSLSDFVLTGSKKFGSINIWSSKLGLNLVGGFNFTKQVHQAKQSEVAVCLKMNSFVNKLTENDVQLLLRQFQQSNIKPKVVVKVEVDVKVDVKVDEEKKEPEVDDNMFAAFGNFFDDAVDAGEAHQPSSMPDEENHSDDEFADHGLKAGQSTEVVQFLSLKDFHQAWNCQLKLNGEALPIVNVDKIVEEQKQVIPVKVEEPNMTDPKTKETIDGLMMMGFAIADVKEAFKQSKKKDLDSVLDVMMELQEKKKMTKVPGEVKIEEKPKIIEYNPYICGSCTFFNEVPMKFCAICNTEAPYTAIKVDEKAKAEEEKAKKDELEKKALQEQKEKERIEKQQKAEELRKQKIEEGQQEIHNYFSNSEILDFYVASVNSGKSVAPLLTFAAFYDKVSSKLDFHFMKFKYRSKYIKNFSKNNSDFQSLLQSKQTAIETLFPVLIENQMQPGWTEFVSQKQQCILLPHHIGVARISLAEVTSISQIGEDITDEKPIFIVVIGKKHSSDVEQTVVVLKIDSQHHINVIENSPLSGSFLQTTCNSIKSTKVMQASGTTKAHMLLQTEDGQLVSARLQQKKDSLVCDGTQQMQLEANENLVSVSNGIMLVQGRQTCRTVALDSELFDCFKQVQKSVESEQVIQSQISEEQVLKLEIDPKKVTTASIDAYENLMQGVIAPSSSNATYKNGSFNEKKNLFTKHTWLCESKNSQECVGPMELRFEKPTNLVSLNIDLCFETINSADFMKSLSSAEPQHPEVAVEEVSQSEKPVEEIIQTEQKQASKAPNLGAFSVKGFEIDDTRPKVGSQKEKTTKDLYIPIVVKRNKGSCYNFQNMANRLIVDNDKMFGSNYPKPEITFQHIDNERISIEKISIRTTFVSKTGAYPMGEGLIFMSDTLEHFENTDMFRNFSLGDYTTWRKQRLTDQRPLRPNEPVAFFKFDSNAQITFELDENRPARYVMLKPTGFRQQPNRLSQNTNLVPMEIQFFGIIGKSSKLSQPLECVQINDPSQNISEQIFSDYTCEVTLLDSNEQVSNIINFKIDQLRVNEISLNPQTLSENSDAVSKTCQIEGLSMLRIADSSILLRKVAGFSIQIKSNKGVKPNWKLTSASVAGYFTKVNSEIENKQDECLFGNANIPSYYYRSCLMTPKFFPVINKQIAKTASDSSFSRRLRIRSMAFLKHIMKLDSDLISLVFSQINIDQFLKTNIIGQDSNCISSACEFLQCFQAEPNFANFLYEILIKQIEQLPEKFVSNKENQTLMGMLKWALPLDFKRTLEVLLDSLYTKITIQKVKQAQTDETIKYRTRFSKLDAINFDCYPFDNQTFKDPKNEVKNGEKPETTQNENIKENLIVQVHMTQKKSSILNLVKHHVVTDAAFYEKVNLNTIKVYMANNIQYQYLMEITITDGPKLVFFKAYPLHVYSQLIEYTDGMYGETKYARALTLPNLNFKGKNLQIDIAFEINQLSKTKVDAPLMPEIAFEFYGKIQDELIDSASKKHRLAIEKNKNKTTVKAVQNSINFIVTSKANGNESEWTPQQTHEEEIKVEAAIEILSYIQDQSTQETVQVEPSVDLIKTQSAKEPDPLEIIQRDLLTIVMGDENGPLSVKLCVSNILKLQSSASLKKVELVPQKSLAYFMDIASQLTKMVKFIVNWKGQQQLSKETIRDCFIALDQTGQQSLHTIGIDLFTHYIAQDAGQANQEMQQFFKDVLLVLMTPKEKSEFFRTLIAKFLTKPQDIISQKAVVEALLNIDITEVDLVQYLQKSLFQDSQDQNPITLMYSLMYMNEKILVNKLKVISGFDLIKTNTKKAKPKSSLPPIGEVVIVESDDAVDETVESLEYDDIFKIFFQVCVQICQNKNNYFDKDERIALLMLAVQNMVILSRVISTSSLQNLIDQHQNMQLILVEVMQLNDSELLSSYQNLLEKVLYRHQKRAKECATIINAMPGAIKLEEVKQFRAFSKVLYKLLSILNGQMLELITGLINLELHTKLRSKDHPLNPLFDKCEADNNLWLYYLGFAIDEYILQINDLDTIHKSLTTKPEDPANAVEPVSQSWLKEINFEEDVEKRSSSGALSILQSLIQILHSKNKPDEVSSFEVNDGNEKQSSFLEQNLSKIWSLTLNSLRTVELNELVEAKLLENLIQAFLRSSEKIKQTTYMQILQISKLIADQNKHGKFLCNLLFTTLPHIDAKLEKDSVVYAICQGWLDILILSNCQGDKVVPALDKNKVIFYPLDAEDISKMLNFVSAFLISLLNHGSFEGSAGAKQIVMIRLNIASDMLKVVLHAKDGERKAIQNLFVKCETTEPLRTELKQTMDHFLLWLVLNGRENKDEEYLKTLGNASLQTPATYLVKEMTTVVNDILSFVAESVQNLESIKIALNSLMTIVRNVNKGVNQRAANEKIGFDTAIKLASRTNELFTKLLSKWLVSDKAVTYFVFQLKGFEFLLDTISCDKVVEVSSNQAEKKTVEKSVVRSALAKSDLFQLVKSVVDKAKDTDPMKVLFIEASTTVNAKCLTDELKAKEEDKFDVPLAEVANQMTLLKTSTDDPVASYARTDWSANKRAYKHKMFTNANAKNWLEYQMLFELPFECLVREIQIGVVNYWTIETEVYVEPLTIVVEAGMDKLNLNHVVTLEMLKDNAFEVQGTTVYGKTIMEIDQERSEAFNNIQRIIQSSLEGMSNFKAKFIQFRFRRANMVCVENSPLVKTINKNKMFAISYISITGFNSSKTVGNYSKLILQEQKKTATEVMAQICSGEFSSVLQVIANQEETINKIKEHFDMLAQQIETKANMIEPTFISISTHNSQMGDWIINQFISNERYQKHATLTGKLVLCDRAFVANRLRMMFEKTVKTLVETNQSKSLQNLTSFLPFVGVFIKTLHFAAPMLLMDHNEIDLAISPEVVSDIISLMGIFANSELTLNDDQNLDDQQLSRISKFVILLITPPKPFVNSRINVYSYATEVLCNPSSKFSQSQQIKMKKFAGMLACQNTKLAQDILSKQLTELFLILQQVKSNQLAPEHIRLVTGTVQFWHNVSYDLKVRARLQSEDIPLLIYEAIKETDAFKSNVQVKTINASIISMLIDLMLKLSVGDQNLELKLAEKVIQDLQSNNLDKMFINQMLLPLLQNERVLPLSLREKLSTQSLVHVEELEETKPFESSFLPSSMLDDKIRADIVKGFGKVGGDQYSEGKWTLVFESTSAYESEESFNKMKDAIQGEGPMLVLQSGTESSLQTKLLFGTFVENKVPIVTHNDNDYDSSGDEEGRELKSSERDIFFINVGGVGMHMYNFKDNYNPSGMMDNKVFYIGFIQIAAKPIEDVFCGVIGEEIKKIDIGYDHNSPFAGAEFTCEEFGFERREIWLYNYSKSKLPAHKKAVTQYKITESMSSKIQKEHPWIDNLSPFNPFRSQPVFMVPSHIHVKTIAKILLKQGVILSPLAISEQNVNDKTLDQVYSMFMQNLISSEKANNILDFEYDCEQLMSIKDEDTTDTSDMTQFVQSQYLPKNTFFDRFQDLGGVKQLISSGVMFIQTWKNEESRKSWSLWLKELESFSQIPFFFQLFLKNKHQKDLLFKIIESEPTSHDKQMQQKQKEAVEYNYKILSEAFSVSKEASLREMAINSGLLPRILERLSAISGEKARIFEEKEEEEKLEEMLGEEPKLSKDESVDPNKTKAARKGVGYSAKQGEIFNVGEYLENKKQRNDQIVILIDICTNLFDSEEWEASSEIVEQILKSALLPILESAFRNGSFLDMAKEAQVYHSYCALTRAIANQKNLAPCLVEIDKRYKPQQVEPIYKLISKLNDLASIFLNCLNQQLNVNGVNAIENPKLQSKQEVTLQKFQQMLKNLKPSSTLAKNQSQAKLKTMNKAKPQIYNGVFNDLEDWQVSSGDNFKSNLLGMVLQQDNLISDMLNLDSNATLTLNNQKQTLTIGTQNIKPEEAKKLMTSLKEFTKMSDNNVVKKASSDSSDDGWQTDSEELPSSSEEETKAAKSKALPKKEMKKEDQVKYTIKMTTQPQKDDQDSGYETFSEHSYDEEKEKDVGKPSQEGKLTYAWEKLDNVIKGVQKQPLFVKDKSKQKMVFKSDSSSSSSIADSIKLAKIKIKCKQSSSSYGSQEASESESHSSDGVPQHQDSHSEYDSQTSEIVSSSGSNGLSPQSSLDKSIISNPAIVLSQITDPNANAQLKQGSQTISQSSASLQKAQIISNANLFLFRNQDVSELLARDVVKTYDFVMSVVDEILQSQQNEHFIDDALQLPIEQQYRALLEPLRFDYMDMKITGTQDYKHHYKSTAVQNQTLPPTKMIRLAQELADLSNALPSNHTDSVFVRVDKQRVDMMKALICGAVGTPYAHGCFEFDIFCENNYPNGPPKMNLMTTGGGQIRFNPNLYHCGKVCLSLLGTWRGQATENWDPKLSTILQLLLSTQAIIMSQEVYFNEPGFEGEAGKPEGERRNEGYSNIVRYGNVKWAMLGQLNNPPKGFETVVKRHFYIKKEEILKDLYKWIERAEKREALYTNLVHDHNSNIAKDFQKSKTRYKEALEKEVKDFEEALNKLDKPTNYLPPPKKKREVKKTEKKKNQAITDGQIAFDEVDVGTDDEDKEIQIDTTGKKQHGKDIDIEDEAVKDRWSRYIGAMGVEAVAKQAAANIFVSGAGALGVEISKNLVLSGCKSFTLHDTKPITQRDLSAQFFLNMAEGKTRSDICLPRLQQLNFYVRCKQAPNIPIPFDHAEMEKEPWNFQTMDVIILTDSDYKTIIAVNEYCRAKGKKFINAQLQGVFGRVFNDFGEQFEVLDKNGEDLQDCMIKSISNEEDATVELLQNAKHKFEDGDECLFTTVIGMKLKEGEKQLDAAFKSDSINDTIRKVKVISPYSFKIGNTLHFEKYEGNGIAKQLRTKLVIKFRSFKETMLTSVANLKQEENLVYCDFLKIEHNLLSHIGFEALDVFRSENKGEMPRAWNFEDCSKFMAIALTIAERYEMKPAEWKADGIELRLLPLFCFQAQGVFNPMSAFFGGFVAQEAVKAITQKFSPINQVFYYDATEVLPEFSPEKHSNTEENKTAFDDYVKNVAKTQEINHRSDGLRIVLGADLVDKLSYANIFMVGAGAIGCELLKNYAMLGVGTGKTVSNPADASKNKKAGSIVLTDPDIIEVSNLNRQFLFREKHLRMPKSQTAAAAAIYMNQDLKGNVIARLDKVHEGTNHIFTDKFFEDLTIVTNALDNVMARKYIDVRCVSAKTPLLESGTLGSKGHVQVILPYKTESYGSMQDPEDNTEIPQCTLKMFPEETLHCVEWARDLFSKLFTQNAQSALKILDEGEKINTVSQQDLQVLRVGLKLLKKRPKNFMDCVEYARMKFEKLFNHSAKQLIHVYPLDAKTKEGNLFWSLPKRPPTPVEFDKDNMLHYQFINAIACLRANIFHVEIPSKAPRTDEFKKQVGEMAKAFKPKEFIPDDSKANEIKQSVNKEAAAKEEEKKDEEVKEETEQLDPNDVQSLLQEFLIVHKQLKGEVKKSFELSVIKPEEFEKDNDSNFHIDFIYSSANIRASCYKLDIMDWITVKLKAGRIVPALATTTASIAGLQALELVKILKGCKLEEFRNCFLNLAVPSMQCPEPGAVAKVKLLDGLEVGLWDRWEIKNAKQMTLEVMIGQLEETYKGLEIRDVMCGNQPIFFHAIMNAQGKENDRKKTLASTIKKLIECDSDDLYVDLAITCTRKDDPEAKILAGVPPVRVHF